MSFKRLDGLLPKSIKKAGITDRITEIRVREVFEEMAKTLIGPQSERLVSVVGVTEHILEVACLNRQSASILFNNRKQLVTGINAEIGKKYVYQLKILQ